MNRIVWILLFASLLFTANITCRASGTEPEKEEINVSEIIFSHTGDAYEWHIITLGKRHINIPLPIIVYSKYSKFNVFMSSELHHHDSYKNFTYGSKDGKYPNKIVEITESGEEYRPFDLSITKNVVGIFIVAIILLLSVFTVVRWYKRNEYEAPRGFRGAIDLLIMNIHDDLIKNSVGPNYRKFAPYLLTVFFFIFISNLTGLIPVFPGGINLTGNIAITFTLAMFTFIIVNVFGTKEYWKEIFWPDTPVFLKVPIPIMPLIELFGIFSKPFALLIRLFANILAGHSAILGLCCLVFITASMGAAVNAGMSFVAIFFMIFMNVLELLIAFIQAYVFTLLSGVFIGLAQVQPHKH